MNFLFHLKSKTNLVTLRKCNSHLQYYKIDLSKYFTFSSYEKVLVLCEKWLTKFSSNLYVLRPPESEKTVLTKVSVCLSVGRARHNSRYNYQIELSFGTLYRSQKRKNKFLNQPHPIKIEGFSTTFVFLKIIFWKNQKFQYWFLIVLINLYKLYW